MAKPWVGVASHAQENSLRDDPEPLLETAGKTEGQVIVWGSFLQV